MSLSGSFRRGLRRVLLSGPANRGLVLRRIRETGGEDIKDKMGFCKGKTEVEEKVKADAITNNLIEDCHFFLFFWMVSRIALKCAKESK